MPSAIIDQVNQIGLNEGQPSLLKFYDNKVNTIGDDDTKIAGVDEATEITGLKEETYENPHNEYETTYVYIEKQYGHEYYKEDRNSHEHNNANLDPPQDGNRDTTQEEDMDPIAESPETEETAHEFS